MHAHPDDELLWMGGTLLRYSQNFRVDFACLTVPFNIPRLKGLFGLEDYFDTGLIICLGYEDDTAVWKEGAGFRFDPVWAESIDFSRYDIVFSHNVHGEYYHPHHVYIHNTLKERSIPFVSFGHLRDWDFIVELSNRDREEKQSALKLLYFSEYTRNLRKFTYWNTIVERFRLEVPNVPDCAEIRNEIMKKALKIFPGALRDGCQASV